MSKVKMLREQQNLTQEELAKKAKISRKTLSELEIGRGNQTRDVYVKLAAALNVEVKELFEKTA